MNTEVMDLSDVGRIEHVWTGIAGRSNEPYFLSWGWIEHWIRSLPNRDCVRLVAVRRESEPVAAFFVGQSRVVRHKVFTGRGLFMNASGNPVVDALCLEYNGILGGGSLDCAAFNEIIAGLPWEWDEFFLPALDRSVMPGKCIDGMNTSCRLVIEKDVPSYYVDLEMVRQNEDFNLLLSKSTRQNVVRSYKTYRQTGPVIFECATTIDRACEIYDELVELHQKAWRARGEPGAFATGFFMEFHRGLIRKRFDSGEIQLSRISAGDVVIGCIYNFVYKGKVFFYQSGINYTSNKVRPGFVSLIEAIKYNAGLGHSVFDFLGGAVDYKKSLGTHSNRLTWVKLQKKHMRYAVENRLREIKHFIKRKTVAA